MRSAAAAIITLLLTASSAHASPSQGINAEPVAGKPHLYTVSIRFSEISEVDIRPMIHTLPANAKSEKTVLPSREWRYDAKKNLLEIDRDVDSAKQMVSVSGKYALPLRIVPAAKTEPSSIRLIVEGRIGKEETDYRYDRKTNEIELTACKTGEECYLVQFGQKDGCASVGSMTGLKREHRRHLSWPLDGNTKPLDASGKRFALTDETVKNVWLVQLLPAKDGFEGKDLLKGFRWDEKKKELTLDEKPGPEFSVFAIGE